MTADERRPGLGTEAAADAITDTIDAGRVTELVEVAKQLDEAQRELFDEVHRELDLAHRAFVVGFDIGFARGQMAGSEDLARAWLEDLGNDMEYQALCTAAEKGSHWQRAILEQARGWDW